MGQSQRRSRIGRTSQWDRLCGCSSCYSGSKRWEDKQPEVAAALRELAEAHAQQDPTFETSIAYTRLTAAQALEQLRQQGFASEQLPAPSTMSVILNRMGYRLKPVVKAKPQKNSLKQTQSLTTSKQKTKAQILERSND